jgi:hypothetical protein
LLSKPGYKQLGDIAGWPVVAYGSDDESGRMELFVSAFSPNGPHRVESGR